MYENGYHGKAHNKFDAHAGDARGMLRVEQSLNFRIRICEKRPFYLLHLCLGPFFTCSLSPLFRHGQVCMDIQGSR